MQRGFIWVFENKLNPRKHFHFNCEERYHAGHGAGAQGHLHRPQGHSGGAKHKVGAQVSCVDHRDHLEVLDTGPVLG